MEEVIIIEIIYSSPIYMSIHNHRRLKNDFEIGRHWTRLVIVKHITHTKTYDPATLLIAEKRIAIVVAVAASPHTLIYYWFSFRFSGFRCLPNNNINIIFYLFTQQNNEMIIIIIMIINWAYYLILILLLP